MGKSLCLTRLLTTVFLLTRSCYGSDDVIIQRLAMPEVEVPTDDLYLCTAVKMDPTEGAFVISFEPNVTQGHAHHVVLYGCSSNPSSDQPVWACKDPNMLSEFGIVPVCASINQTSYLFGMTGTTRLYLPEGVGFEVGGNFGLNYIVLEIHYANSLPPGVRDSSGVNIHKTNRRLTKRAGSVMSWTLGSLPAHSVTSMDAVCDLGEKKTIHSIAYKVHTHDLGMLVSGYFVTRNVSTGLDEWTLVGERSPQLPQDFIPIGGKIDVNVGDRLASQCWMNNTHDRVIKYGLTHRNNEMCIFYFFYWVEDEAPLNKRLCISPGPPEDSWATSNDVNNVPDKEVPASG